MPRTVKDAEGNDIEVPTQEEIDALNAKASSADTLAQEKANLEKQLQEEANPDFRSMRQGAKKREKLEAEAKKLGYEVMEDGSLVKPNDKPINSDDVASTSEKAARKVLVEDFVENEISGIPENHRQEVQDLYETMIKDKGALSKAEAAKYLNYAKNAVDPNMAVSRSRQSMSAPVGGEPIFDSGANGGVSEGAKDMARSFGLDAKKLEKGDDVSDLIFSKK